MGDVVNYVVLKDEESDYANLAFAVMCTSESASGRRDLDILAQFSSGLLKNENRFQDYPFTFFEMI